MKVNINKTRGLDIVGEDFLNDENKEYYVLLKVQPVAEELRGGEVTMKVAVDNGLAIHVRKEDAQYLISHREQQS